MPTLCSDVCGDVYGDVDHAKQVWQTYTSPKPAQPESARSGKDALCLSATYLRK